MKDISTRLMISLVHTKLQITRSRSRGDLKIGLKLYDKLLESLHDKFYDLFMFKIDEIYSQLEINIHDKEKDEN